MKTKIKTIIPAVTLTTTVGSAYALILIGMVTSSQAAQIVDDKVFYYQNNNYKIGISTTWGAAVYEFYNKRVDSDATMNLIQPFHGAAFQTAIFGDDAHEAFAGTNCGDANDPVGRWNPTQAGEYCGDVLHRPALVSGSGSQILSCVSSASGWCNSSSINEGAQSTGNSIAYTVHYRNYDYELGQVYSNYQPYDDVYGQITYKFLTDYVQIDYVIWKMNSNVYGAGGQQLPVVFIDWKSKVSTQNNSPSASLYYPIGPDTGRWAMVEPFADNGSGAPNKKFVNGNFITFAFYQAPYIGTSKDTDGILKQLRLCPKDRHFQADLTTVLQNASTFQLSSTFPIQVRTLVFPYRATEGISNGGQVGWTLKDLVNTQQSSGGLMPSWECGGPNSAPVADLSVPTPFTFTGNWPTGFQFGLKGDIPLVGLVNPIQGGESTPGAYPMVFRPNGGYWYVNSGFKNYDGSGPFQFGLQNDIPFVTTLAGVGWCGDPSNFQCPVVFRPSTATWYVNGFYQNYQSGSNPAPIQFGLAGDIPMIIPYNGGNHIAVYRPNTRQLFVNTDNKSYHGNFVILPANNLWFK